MLLTLAFAASLVPVTPAQSVTGPQVLVDSTTSPTGQFGTEIAVSGDLLAVGAPGTVNGGASAGSVVLWRRSAQGWQFEARIDAPAAIGSNARFGDAIDVQEGPVGEELIVGAPAAQTTTGGTDRGAVFTYRRTTGGWVQEATLLGNPMIRSFGSSVAFSGDTAVIGQPDFGGRAHTASRSAGGPWSLDGELPLPPTVFAGGDFGTSVAIDGDVIAVGAPGEDAASYDSGAAYVYRRVQPGGAAFALETRLEHPSAATVTYQGVDVAVDTSVDSTERILMGSQDDAAFIYARGATGAWLLESLLLPFDGEGGGFGTSVALAGTRAIVGAPWRLGSDSGSGAALTFERTGSGGATTWIPTGLLHPGLGIDRDAGRSVALDGDRAVVGAPSFAGQGPSSGAVLTYRLDARLGEAHCAGRRNSIQSSASIAAFGSLRPADENLGFDVVGLPPGSVGFPLTAESRAQVPGLGGGQGDLCLGGTISRLSLYVRTADPAGTATVQLDFAVLPGLVQFTAGSTWSFQWWHRDTGTTPTSNTSHALELTFE